LLDLADMVGVPGLIPGFMALIEAAAMAARAMAQSTQTQSPDISEVPAQLDIEDVQRARRGDPDGYRRLVERHQDHVGRILWRFSRDRSVHEELVQDVFVEAYLSLGQYAGRAPFEHWLARIATRVGYRYWKETARRTRPGPFSLQQWHEAAGDGRGARLICLPVPRGRRLPGRVPRRPHELITITCRYLGLRT
jgi:hypothetical protein